MRQPKLNEQEIKVNELLNTWDVEFNVVTLGEVKKDDWTCDQHNVSFNGESFDYYTGTGHRVYNDWKTKFRVFVSAASVLYALILDSDAEQHSFNDWCDCFGYNNDSKKANRIYDDCLHTARS